MSWRKQRHRRKRWDILWTRDRSANFSCFIQMRKVDPPPELMRWPGILMFLRLIWQRMYAGILWWIWRKWALRWRPVTMNWPLLSMKLISVIQTPWRRPIILWPLRWQPRPLQSATAFMLRLCQSPRRALTAQACISICLSQTERAEICLRRRVIRWSWARRRTGLWRVFFTIWRPWPYLQILWLIPINAWYRAMTRLSTLHGPLPPTAAPWSESLLQGGKIQELSCAARTLPWIPIWRWPLVLMQVWTELRRGWRCLPAWRAICLLWSWRS